MADSLNVFVTGGAGFIGSHLVHRLSTLDCVQTVKVLDHFSHRSVVDYTGLPKVSFIKGDVQDESILSEALRNIDVIFHLADKTSTTGGSITSFTDSATELGLLQAAVRQRVRRFIFASSCAVYGASKTFPTAEDAPLLPLSPYARKKVAIEELVESFVHLHGLECLTLRFFNVYGQRQRPGPHYAAVVSRFIEAAKAGSPVIVTGSGRQTRDFVHISDAVEALCRSGLFYENCTGSRVFNVGTGIETTIGELAVLVQRITEVPVSIVITAASAAEVYRSQADPSLSADLLGFTAAVTITEGISEMWQAMRK